MIKRERDIDIKLADAAEFGKTAECRKLIEAGADVNEFEWQGWKVLHCAVLSGNAGTVKLILDNGADVDAQTDGGLTPLHIAVIENKLRVIPTLLRAGADTSIMTFEKYHEPDARYRKWEFCTPYDIACELYPENKRLLSTLGPR